MKIRIGDVFTIKTKKGLGYFQVVELPVDNNHCHLIKVFCHVFKEQNKNIRDVLEIEETYFIEFPVQSARNKKIISKVGFLPLPENFIPPRIMRDKMHMGGNKINWYLVDRYSLKRSLVKDLNTETLELSPIGVINDTLLIERYDSGWELKKWK